MKATMKTLHALVSVLIFMSSVYITVEAQVSRYCTVFPREDCFNTSTNDVTEMTCNNIEGCIWCDSQGSPPGTPWCVRKSFCFDEPRIDCYEPPNNSANQTDCLAKGCNWCPVENGPLCVTDGCSNTRLCFSPHEKGITRGYCHAPGNKCIWCPTIGNLKYDGRCVENCPPGHRLRYAHTDQCCKETIAITSRITGGKPATRGRWPWQGYLIVRLPTNLTARCGAVLISPSLALTAAHCVAGISSIIFVYFGLQNTTNIDPQSMVRFGPSFVIHPGYNPSTVANDIAVINLTPLIVFNDVVQPVALPQSEIVPIGTKCIATGFGLAIPGGVTSTRLLEVTKFIQPNEICNRYGIYNESIQICAGTLSGQEGGTTCQGDSGGPLVCQRCSSCEWYVAGLTSFGPRNCNDPNIAPAFARVSYYEPWIRSQGYVPPNNITHSCP